MDLRGWDQRYRSQEKREDEAGPTPLLIETAERLQPGKALDLACGTGRNALWLAGRGWTVTAVDGAPEAIRILRKRAQERGMQVDAQVVDLEKAAFRIGPSAGDGI